MDYKIRKVELLYCNQVARRKVKVTLTNGTKIYITPWEQFGGTESELWTTLPIAEKYNKWLHGEE